MKMDGYPIKMKNLANRVMVKLASNPVSNSDPII